jgi:hypothetical protein
VQPREAAARRGRDDRERPERLGLTCTTTSPEKTVSDYPLFRSGARKPARHAGVAAAAGGGVEWSFGMPLTPPLDSPSRVALSYSPANSMSRLSLCRVKWGTRCAPFLSHS